jgi:hypothetical protein
VEIGETEEKERAVKKRREEVRKGPDELEGDRRNLECYPGISGEIFPIGNDSHRRSHKHSPGQNSAKLKRELIVLGLKWLKVTTFPQ